MASVYVIEIDGWGEVGPAIGVTNAEGFADGTFTLTFSDCNHAVLTYDMPGAGLEGTIPLERSVKDNAALCESLSQALQGAAQ